MNALQWTGLLLLALAIISAAFMALWFADARRADRMAADPGRFGRRTSWRRPTQHRATHRAHP
jgi:hypothetical protein